MNIYLSRLKMYTTLIPITSIKCSKFSNQRVKNYVFTARWWKTRFNYVQNIWLFSNLKLEMFLKMSSINFDVKTVNYM